MKTKSFEKGFTLIELLIVIAIIAILVVIVVVALNPVRLIEQSRDSRRRSELDQVKTSLQLYYNDCKQYPTDGQVVFGSALGNSGNGVDGAAGTCDDAVVYMRQVPSDTGAAYDYRVDATRQNYQIVANLSWPNSDDTNSRTKCDNTTLFGSYPANTDFVVCND